MTDTEDRDRILQAMRAGAKPFLWEYGVTSIDGATAAILPLLAEARQQGAREAAGKIAEELERILNTANLIRLADTYSGYYQGVRSGYQHAAQIARQEAGDD